MSTTNPQTTSLVKLPFKMSDSTAILHERAIKFTKFAGRCDALMGFDDEVTEYFNKESLFYMQALSRALVDEHSGDVQKFYLEPLSKLRGAMEWLKGERQPGFLTSDEYDDVMWPHSASGLLSLWREDPESLAYAEAILTKYAKALEAEVVLSTSEDESDDYSAVIEAAKAANAVTERSKTALIATIVA